MNRNLKYSLIIVLLVAFFFYQKSQVVLKPQLDKEAIPAVEIADNVEHTSSKKENREAEPLEAVTMRSVAKKSHVNYHFVPKAHQGVLVAHQTYTLSYVEEHEQAEWVAYKLNKRFTNGDTKRSSSFKYDKAVLTQSASANDYKYSGYDRGHLLAAADRKNSKLNMKETFLMSNISPQHPNLNRQAWKYLEEELRASLGVYDSLYIVTGPIMGDLPKKIGENEVSIPDYFYKIVLNYTSSNKLCATAFLFPNKSVKRVTPDHIVTIDSVEVLTGIDFFASVPIEIQAQFESQNCLQLLD